MKAKYLDPFTDFGFKRLFGQEASKTLMLDFLNVMLPPTARIQKLAFQRDYNFKVDSKLSAAQAILATMGCKEGGKEIEVRSKMGIAKEVFVMVLA